MRIATEDVKSCTTPAALRVTGGEGATYACAAGREVCARRKHISQINLGPNGASDYAQRWQIPAVSAVSRRQTAPMRTLKVKYRLL